MVQENRPINKMSKPQSSENIALSEARCSFLFFFFKLWCQQRIGKLVVLADENHWKPPSTHIKNRKWLGRRMFLKKNQSPSMPCKLQEALMCNYQQNSQFNSRNAPVSKGSHAPRRGPHGSTVTFEKPPRVLRQAFNTQRGDLKKRKKTTVGESVLMCLTVASGLILIRYWLQALFPQPYKALVIIAQSK